jgi:hypothetical protein
LFNPKVALVALIHPINKMKKVNLLFSFLLLTLIMMSSCSSEKSKDVENKHQQPKSETTDTIKKTSEVAPVEKPQTFDERIKEIKQIYAEFQKLGMKNCDIKKRVKLDGFDIDSEKSPFDQIVKTCRLNENYELITGEFSGYEFAYTISIYKNKGKIIFVFVEGGAEGWSFQKRYYCDKEENLILQLEREAYGGEEITEANREIKLDPTKPKIQDNIDTFLNDIKFVLGKKL